MVQFTFYSCLDIKDLFISMFCEQEVISKFSLSKTKCVYIINFWIAPYFKELLTQCIKDHSFTLLSLMNHSILKCKSSQWISKYDFGTLKITVWKHDTTIFNFITDLTLITNVLLYYQCINTGTIQLSKQQMVQLSMDGPNINWKVLEKFNTARESNDDPCLADIWSCSLYIVSGSLNADVTETSM